MKRIFGSHPALYAFLLGGGAFSALYFGYNLWDPSEGVKSNDMDTNAVVASYWVFCGVGVLMWAAGGVIFGRNRGINGFLALVIHLALPVIGLMLMGLLKRPLTPREAWIRDNPGMDETTARRTYRPMKPLY